MSLAMSAALFEDETNNAQTTNSNGSNYINNKKRNNKTLKMYKEGFDKNKVNHVLQKLHNQYENEDDEDDYFKQPPPNPISVGTQKTKPEREKENMVNMTSPDFVVNALSNTPKPMYENEDDLDLNNYRNYGTEEFYKNYMKNVNVQSNNDTGSYYQTSAKTTPTNSSNYSSPQDVLLQKLNYMITLLEEQHDQKTDSALEEVVLYSFLGIFIIFVSDTFVKAGKYIR
jgi:hypothetical protein